MPSVYIEENKKRKQITLSFGEYASIIYHDMFDFPLTFDEVTKWNISEDYLFSMSENSIDVQKIDFESGHFYVGDNKQNIHKRLLKKESSERKIEMAYRAANILRILPSVLFVGVTGSLAMENADDNSDIDLMIITSSDMLWVTRLLSLLLLMVFGLKIRRKHQKEQQDRICANIWLTEDKLEWKDKNIFTAHEIAQTKPLLNRKDIYKCFLYKNIWVQNYFPNSIKHVMPSKLKTMKRNRLLSTIYKYINKLCFHLQYKYMQNSITNEVVSIKKALFHPMPLSDYVENRFKRVYLSN